MKNPLIKLLKACLPVLFLLPGILPALSQPRDNERIEIVDEEAQHFKTQAAYLSHKQSYVALAASMHIVPTIANNWYNSRVNLAEGRKLKRVGIDLREMATWTNHTTDYKYHTLFSDVIVSGKVIDKVYEKSRTSYWHTMYTVQVTNVLKGSSLDSVKIYQVSGYVEGTSTHLLLDQLLSVGDKGIFYLNYWTSGDIALVQEGLSSGYGGNGATEANITDDGRSFGMTLFQPNEKGYIYTEGNREGRTSRITSKIQKIAEINDADTFYRTNF